MQAPPATWKPPLQSFTSPEPVSLQINSRCTNVPRTQDTTDSAKWTRRIAITSLLSYPGLFNQLSKNLNIEKIQCVWGPTEDTNVSNQNTFPIQNFDLTWTVKKVIFGLPVSFVQEVPGAITLPKSRSNFKRNLSVSLCHCFRAKWVLIAF